MRLLSTLYVTDHRAKVSVAKRNLVVNDSDGGRVRVPIESLDAMVLLGQAQVTSQALDICVRSGIAVTSLTRTGKVRFSVLFACLTLTAVTVVIAMFETLAWLMA